MPEENQKKSLRPRWLPLWLWQLRWWVVGTLFVLVWWLLPPLLYRHTGTPPADKLKAITDTRTALLAGLIGVGALLTFWLNSRVYRITTRTLEVTEQGHITDRYTKAIAQLGDDALTVRLGGIYALERIAKDSPRDHPTVVEVLSAFVRESSPPPKQGIAQEAAEKPDATTPGTDAKAQPATDVQAALSVLGRLPQQPHVSRGDLTGAQVAGARLGGANLSGAWLPEVNLRSAWLVGANLMGAWLDRADLSGAQLSGAKLMSAQLDGGDLTSAQLPGADLSGAGLTRAKLAGARLDWADLSGAQLRGADLSGASLARVNLSGADLNAANLSGASLAWADLRQAQELRQSQLYPARGNELTQLPDWMHRPEHWMTDDDPMREFWEHS
jgi:hypothetical protein